ncbi:putative WD40 repeat protein [Monocercomonoides exilis]|uniref:putative WD40 repeat protein n=1 Tax=Monocercomonoides exilis TaxID=2049356 RepID=UPI003559CEA3|nr:putative WD40 repeat protein [Monocercomonoides exilis]|eukprot:MONOS_9547.1-p1 / transcript=MONOS_9547.1 / gene=MONOS_9547 / organism=Monocercomonoides_exilis_PA203 / gene_product=WD40 repeat protein / transcript_product=WD40 repeat protein / location=Mono_scaffold00398:39308-45305(-) / protein_length=1227 / sequence_SO=supercontig / SO=protein_coding / is_pseudo=false
MMLPRYTSHAVPIFQTVNSFKCRGYLMQYIKGETLTTFMKKTENLNVDIIRHVFAQILDCLCAMNTAGMIHRDLKADNVLIATEPPQPNTLPPELTPSLSSTTSSMSSTTELANNFSSVLQPLTSSSANPSSQATLSQQNEAKPTISPIPQQSSNTTSQSLSLTQSSPSPPVASVLPPFAPKQLPFTITQKTPLAVVADYGTARHDIHNGALLNATLNIGTPMIRAPELFRDKRDLTVSERMKDKKRLAVMKETSIVSGKEDIYSFGVVLFKVVSGHFPFDYPPSRPGESRQLHISPDFSPLERLSHDCADLCRLCLSVNPVNRLSASAARRHPFFASVGESEEELECRRREEEKKKKEEEEKLEKEREEKKKIDNVKEAVDKEGRESEETGEKPKHSGSLLSPSKLPETRKDILTLYSVKEEDEKEEGYFEQSNLDNEDQMQQKEKNRKKGKREQWNEGMNEARYDYLTGEELDKAKNEKKFDENYPYEYDDETDEDEDEEEEEEEEEEEIDIQSSEMRIRRLKNSSRFSSEISLSGSSARSSSSPASSSPKPSKISQQVKLEEMIRHPLPYPFCSLSVQQQLLFPPIFPSFSEILQAVFELMQAFHSHNECFAAGHESSSFIKDEKKENPKGKMNDDPIARQTDKKYDSNRDNKDSYLNNDFMFNTIIILLFRGVLHCIEALKLPLEKEKEKESEKNEKEQNKTSGCQKHPQEETSSNCSTVLNPVANEQDPLKASAGFSSTISSVQTSQSAEEGKIYYYLKQIDTISRIAYETLKRQKANMYGYKEMKVVHSIFEVVMSCVIPTQYPPPAPFLSSEAQINLISWLHLLAILSSNTTKVQAPHNTSLIPWIGASLYETANLLSFYQTHQNLISDFLFDSILFQMADPRLPPVDAKQSDSDSSKKEIYTFTASHPVYSVDWSWRKEFPYRLAFTSFTENLSNRITLIQLDESARQLKQITTVEHQFPPTKVMWMPYTQSDKPDLFATTGDFLRIWELKGSSVVNKCVLNSQTPGSEHHAPLTSFDWNFTDPNIIGTSSIDTTCTIWDIQNERAMAQLIAHDKEVFDIAFTSGVHVFTTVGADGSVRLFDLRNLEHSTIIYESPKYSPLLRVKWSHVEPNYLATLILDTATVVILDIRQPSLPLLQLTGHTQPTNSIDWAPSSPHYIASGSDDSNAFIWDLRSAPKEIKEPYLAYHAAQPINTVSWSSQHPSWIAIAMETLIQILRI